MTVSAFSAAVLDELGGKRVSILRRIGLRAPKLAFPEYEAV